MSSARDHARGRKRLRILTALVLGAITVGAAEAASAAPSIHGFVLDKKRVVTIDHPDAVTFTSATAINKHGAVVGSFDDELGAFHGYVRDRRGRFTQLDYPGAAFTALHRINDAGQIVGAYRETLQSRRVGFVYDHGTFTPILVEGAIETDANGINEDGQVAGWYLMPDGGVHGFVWDDGAVTTVDAPRAFFTELIDINDSGELVGDYGDPRNNELHGLFVSDGDVTTFDAPDFPLTGGNGLNNRGQIAAIAAADLTGSMLRAFLLLEGACGPFTPFAIPGAVQTQPFDIDDRGRVVGIYATGTTAGLAQAALADLGDVFGRAELDP